MEESLHLYEEVLVDGGRLFPATYVIIRFVGSVAIERETT